MKSSRHCASFSLSQNTNFIKKNLTPNGIILLSRYVKVNCIKKLAGRPEHTHTPICLHISLVCRIDKQIFDLFFFATRSNTTTGDWNPSKIDEHVTDTIVQPRGHWP